MAFRSYNHAKAEASSLWVATLPGERLRVFFSIPKYHLSADRRLHFNGGRKPFCHTGIIEKHVKVNSIKRGHGLRGLSPSSLGKLGTIPKSQNWCRQSLGRHFCRSFVALFKVTKGRHEQAPREVLQLQEASLMYLGVTKLIVQMTFMNVWYFNWS